MARIRVDLCGCGYSPDQEQLVEEALANLSDCVIVRGRRAPAAGSELAVTICLSLMAGVAANLLTDCIKLLIARVKKTLRGTCVSGGSFEKISVEDEESDYIVNIDLMTGFGEEPADIDSLIGRMRGFCDAERLVGRPVLTVEAPCRIVMLDEVECECTKIPLG